jgi:hypothetical protein
MFRNGNWIIAMKLSNKKGMMLHKDSPHFVVLKYASITGTFWPVVFRQVKP